MDVPAILKAVDDAVALGFQALVLQSGEDPFYTDDMLEEIVVKIRRRHPVLIFASVGERSFDAYRRMYNAGARGALLRFETSNAELYEKIKPGACHSPRACHSREGGNPQRTLASRLSLISQLTGLGYLVATGFLVGLPGQTSADVMRDIKQTAALKAEMFSFGPFIPHPKTPLADVKAPTLKKTLDTIARARIMNPDAKILVTTAMETLWGLNGAREALMAGANSLMINVTPKEYRRLYDIYPERFGTDMDAQEHVNVVIDLLRSLGRAPTDLSVK
jgi:biotin synthase